jgi:hypothetical protein
MAPPKRRTGGRTTPKGTQPTQRVRHENDDRHESSPASTRYTPPTAQSLRESPPWVPVLMLTLLGLGALVILLYYLGFVPGGRSNWYLFSGLVCMLGGLFTATKWR